MSGSQPMIIAEAFLVNYHIFEMKQFASLTIAVLVFVQLGTTINARSIGEEKYNITIYAVAVEAINGTANETTVAWSDLKVLVIPLHVINKTQENDEDQDTQEIGEGEQLAILHIDHLKAIANNKSITWNDVKASILFGYSNVSHDGVNSNKIGNGSPVVVRLEDLKAVADNSSVRWEDLKVSALAYPSLNQTDDQSSDKQGEGSTSIRIEDLKAKSTKKSTTWEDFKFANSGDKHGGFHLEDLKAKATEKSTRWQDVKIAKEYRGQKPTGDEEEKVNSGGNYY